MDFFSAGKFMFSLFNTFYISELKRGKNPVKTGGNHKKPKKKGEKKGRKKGTVNDPNLCVASVEQSISVGVFQ
jgi:hypothetical protein